ncbi:slc1a3 [Pungitius sinensis]
MLGTVANQHLAIGDGLRSWTSCRKYCFQYAFLYKNVVSVTLGITIGLYLKMYKDLSPNEKALIGIPGDLLIRMLELVSIPLVTTSVILGISSLSNGVTKKIAFRSAWFILITTTVCSSLGITLVLLFKPGAGQTGQGELVNEVHNYSLWHGLFDLLRNLMPQNPIQTCFRHYKSVWKPFPSNRTQPSSLETRAGEMKMVGSYADGVNMLGVIVYSFVCGHILQNLEGRSRILLDLIAVIATANRFVVNLILGYLPIGVLFMIISSILDLGDFDSLFVMAEFMGVIVFGLALHSVVILPLLYYLLVRKNPLTVVRGVYPALIAAWFISSSSATLPITLRCCEGSSLIDHRIARFMLPIATTVNKNGTALYEAAAAVFVAQFHNIHLTMGELVTIMVTSVVSSLGSSGLPAMGAVTTVFVLSSVGIPVQNGIILVTMEWLLDRCNTVVNVLGDCFSVSLVHHLSQNDLIQSVSFIFTKYVCS